MIDLAKVKKEVKHYDDALIHLKEAGKIIKRIPPGEAQETEIVQNAQLEIKRAEADVKDAQKKDQEEIMKKAGPKNTIFTRNAIFITLCIAAGVIIGYAVAKKT